MKAICLTVLLSSMSATPSIAFGQYVELGGSLGTGARGSDGELVIDEARLTGGFHVSSWWADRFEAGFRLVWVDLPSINARTGYGFDCASGV
jgi:hypothetical protein